MKCMNQCFLLAALMIVTLVEPLFLKNQAVWAAKVDKAIHRKNIKAFEQISDSIDRKDYKTASIQLDKLASITKLNNLERVYIANFRSFICSYNNDLECAVSEHKKILERKAFIPETFYLNTLRSLANFYFNEENYSEFSAYADEYLSALSSDRLSKELLVGKTYFASQNYEKALSFVLARLDMVPSNQLLDSRWVYFLIKTYKALNKLEEALAFVDSMNAFNPTIKYKLRIAQYYDDLGMKERAQSFRQELIDKGLAGYKNDKLVVWNSEGPPLPIYRPTPNYPYRARKRLLEGWVDLIVDIDVSGKTKNIRITDSSRRKMFDKAALEAAKGYIYGPFIKNGERVEFKDHNFRISFLLNN
ncbi:energy transducer TonB [Arenicella sp. 4NH20-0111]|uniref:energy transducer TonB n=1 Tax=Arenicella sp. 4NH20-0111 TaxID=3127648 RepID=UPI003340933F